MTILLCAVLPVDDELRVLPRDIRLQSQSRVHVTVLGITFVGIRRSIFEEFVSHFSHQSDTKGEAGV
jgi:hypothetical protein